MKYILFYAITLTFLIGCKNSPEKVNYERSTWSKKEINRFIVNWSLENNKMFDWKNAPDKMVYSALYHGDSFLYVNYKAQSDGREMPPLDAYELPEDWLKKRDEIADFILEKERGYRKQPNLSLKDLLRPHKKQLSHEFNEIQIQVTNPSTITELRANKTVIMIQPGYFGQEEVILKMMSDSIKKRKERG